MAEDDPRAVIERLSFEVETLRMANDAIQDQMSRDAARNDEILRAMEEQAAALRAATRRHAKQADFTQRVMDTSSALMIVLEADGRIRQVNRPFLAVFGIEAAAAGGRVLDDWLVAEEREALAVALPPLPWAIRSPLYETLRATGTYAAEHRLVDAKGLPRVYWLEASLQYDPSGKEEGAVFCGTDITPLKEQQAALRRSENLLREAQRIAQLGHWELDVPSRSITFSEDIGVLFETPRIPRDEAELLGLVHPEDRESVRRAIETAIATGGRFGFAHRLLLADGRIKWIEARGVVQCDADGRSRHVLGTSQDVTVQRLADEELSIAASVFETSLNGVVITDAQARILKTNDSFSRILGYPAEEMLGKKTNLFNSRRHDANFYREMWRALEQDDEWQGEIWDRRKDGEIVPLWQSITTLRDAEGRVKNYVGVFYDLSDQKRSAAHIHHLAYFDALTDLPNRMLFNDRCAQALETAERGGRQLALLFLDLDRFKYVNDTLGHQVGDELLCKVARRLTRGLRRSDTVARLGGDEFIVLMQNCRDHDCVRRLASKIITLFEKPFVVMGHRLDIRTSIGISLYPNDGADTETLVKNADLAMYKAKEHGRGQFLFYEAKFGEQVKERLFLESELRDALRRDELTLHYQPQLDLKTGRIIGSEALLRWHHPVRGMISPTKFIPVAEDTGLILEIGEWVLRTACRQTAAWLAEGLGPHRIAVNLSGAQIERGDVVALVGRVLEETDLPVASLELEVTETYVMRKAKQSIRVLEGLRDLGVGLAIDDFGTGHSSLAYLQRLPVDKLKIDRSFVTDLTEGDSQAAIARAVIALGHSLRLKVLAEGVETTEQARLLEEHGCDEVQGFLYGRPMEADALRSRLEAQVAADHASNIAGLREILRRREDRPEETSGPSRLRV